MSQEMPTNSKRNILAAIFISPDEPRLRAGWRLLLQTLLIIVFGAAIFNIANILRLTIDPGDIVVGQILNLVVITGSVYIVRRWLDKRSFESLGLKLDMQALYDILAGIGITFVQMGFISILMLCLGWWTF